MKLRPQFRREAYEAAKLLCANDRPEVIIAFDYKLIQVDQEGEAKNAAQFFQLPADAIVKGVISGELPIGDEE